LRRGNDWPRPPSPSSKKQNAKIPDGGGPGFESSQQQQELDSVHRIGTATAAESSLGSLGSLALSLACATKRNATQNSTARTIDRELDHHTHFIRALH